MRKNKKGSLQDILLIGSGIFLLCILVLVFYRITNDVNNEFQSSDEFSNRTKNFANTMVGYYPGLIDNSILFVTISLSIVAFILASLVRIHPIFIPIYIIVLIGIIYLCGIFSNIYQEIAGNPNFITLANNLTFTNHIMTYLPFIVGIFGSLLAIVMYKGYKDGQENY